MGGGGGTEGAGVVIQGGDVLMGAGDLKSKEIKAATIQVGVDQDIDGAAVDVCLQSEKFSVKMIATPCLNTLRTNGLSPSYELRLVI